MAGLVVAEPQKRSYAVLRPHDGGKRISARLTELRVYDGRVLTGTLRERGKKVSAYTCTGKYIGRFKSRSAAVRAIPHLDQIREAAE